MNPMNKIGQIYLRTNIKFSAPFFLLQLVHHIYTSVERAGEFLPYPFYFQIRYRAVFTLFAIWLNEKKSKWRNERTEKNIYSDNGDNDSNNIHRFNNKSVETRALLLTLCTLWCVCDVRACVCVLFDEKFNSAFMYGDLDFFL